MSGFNVVDAVALARFMRSEKIDKIEYGHISGLIKTKEAEPKTGCRSDAAMAALRKLTDSDEFERIADINDDPFGNDVEFEDLIKGFVRGDVYVRIEEEIDGKRFLQAFQTKCPTQFSVLRDLRSSSTIPEDAKLRAQRAALESCDLSTEKDLAKNLMVAAALRTIFAGETNPVPVVPVGDVFTKSSAYLLTAEHLFVNVGVFGSRYREEYLKLVHELYDPNTIIPAELKPYLVTSPSDPEYRCLSEVEKKVEQLSLKVLEDLGSDIADLISKGNITAEAFVAFVVGQIVSGVTDYSKLLEVIAKEYPQLRPAIEKLNKK